MDFADIDACLEEEPEPDLADWEVLVANGTVADKPEPFAGEPNGVVLPELRPRERPGPVWGAR